jgi:hypothetical protein
LVIYKNTNDDTMLHAVKTTSLLSAHGPFCPKRLVLVCCRFNRPRMKRSVKKRF